MKYKYLIILSACAMLLGCATKKPDKASFHTDFYMTGVMIRLDTLTFIDSSRQRTIPVTIYHRTHFTYNNKQKLVIINPGYGGTRDGYHYIAAELAAKGYLVVTIQHDLPADAPLPQTGDLYKLRKPFWDTGVKSIFFVTEKIRARYPDLDYDHIILIGHSNGGDMAMLIANEYPEFAKVVITLDNRRVPFPRSRTPKILSIRSSDQPADAGVLPSLAEQRKYKIKIIKVHTTHNDMGGSADLDQKKEINDYIADFLNENL